jgi:hypothetical protein
MKHFKEWVKNNWDTLKKISPCPYSNLLRPGYIAGMERALQLYCEDVADFHENILQELKGLDN